MAPSMTPHHLSAGARVALALLISVILGVFLLTSVAYVIYYRQAAGDRDQTLVEEARAYDAFVTTLIEQRAGDLAEASEQYIRVRGYESPAILAVHFTDGTPSITSGEAGFVGNAANQASLNLTSTARSFDQLTIGREEYRVATVPVLDDEGQVVAVFQAALPTEAFREMLSQFGSPLLLAAAVVILVGGLLSRWLARATLRPLHDAAVVAGQVSDYSLSRRIPYEGPQDDVGLLVASLNGMLDRLEAAFAEQRRFVADASHEMRTPITIIRGHLDVMRAEGGLTPEHESTLDLVAEELQRTTTLVSDLLNLARLEGGPPPPFVSLDLAEVVEEAVVRVQGLGERRMSFQHGGQLPVRGNQDLLLQAILNLLTNAVRHTRPGGRIEVACYADEGIAGIEVGDDGPGIPEEDLERIFDRFYRSQRSPRGSDSGGSGLGLAIARRLVQVHGGELRAHNRPAGGALFVLELPLLNPSLDDSNAALTAV